MSRVLLLIFYSFVEIIAIGNFTGPNHDKWISRQKALDLRSACINQEIANSQPILGSVSGGVNGFHDSYFLEYERLWISAITFIHLWANVGPGCGDSFELNQDSVLRSHTICGWYRAYLWDLWRVYEKYCN